MKKLYSFLLLLSIAAFTNAQTNVSGGIYANTTWTLANSPYIVVDTVVVFPGVTLTIEPGVVVKFENNKKLDVRYQATIIAQGTITDSITFTSNSTAPTPGIYKGVGLITAHGKFSYCNFMYAQYGIGGSYFSSDTMRIKNSVFKFNNVGYNNINTNSSSPTYIDSCIFTDNTSFGYAAGSCQSTLTSCYVANNGTGLALNGTIRFCTIRNNQTGITGNGSVYNSIINANQKGVVGSNSDNYNLYNCTIDSNTICGIYDDVREMFNCEVKYNPIGLDHVYGNIIRQNIIEDNTIGLNGGYATSMYCNRICNISYNYISIGSGNWSLANNYWCTADSDSIAAKIYDGYDNIALGLIDFTPLDTLNCYLTGCNLHINANVTNATCDTCQNGSATAIIVNGFAPYSYTWYTAPIQITQTATGLASGTYTVCVTDGHGCTACNYNVFVDSTNCTGFAMNAVATNASCSLCSDGTGTANITGGTPPYAYTWYTNPIQSTQTATGLIAGTYAVCVTDLYGCPACDTITVGIGSCASYYTITAGAGPHTYDLTNMASGTAPLTYDWSWGDGSPNDTGAYPTHTYAGAGTYTICLSIIDSAGCTDTYCHSFYLVSPMSSTAVTVNVIPPVTTAIAEDENEKSFSVFPNPASGYLILRGEFSGAVNATIYNVLGEKKSHSMITTNETNINLSGLAGGIYFIEVAAGNKVRRKMFVKV
jgi:hypothetical protein